jgi:cysteine desulfurase
MQVPYERARGAIRFSLSRYTTADDIEHTLKILPEILNQMAES